MPLSTIARLGEVASARWGLITTAQAATVGVSRKTMSDLAATGTLIRIAHGVYRIAGAPELEHEQLHATWLALGGATLPPTPTGAPAVVAAGETAAIAHRIGDWYPNGHDFIVPTRRGTRLPGVRLRVRDLTPTDVTYIDGLPTLTVERTIADLVTQWADRSLIADTIADAVTQGKLLSPTRLAEHLDPAATANGHESGTELAEDLLALAGVDMRVRRG
jgi:predicted transcriptional regulator of viral defense system